MDGGAWWATVHGVEKSWTRLNDFISLNTRLGKKPQVYPKASCRGRGLGVRV